MNLSSAIATVTGAALLLSGAALATEGTASAAPCDTYKPTSSDALATTSLGTAMGSAAPSWAQGLPVGLFAGNNTTKSLSYLTGLNSPDADRMLGLNSTDLGIMWDSGDGRTLAAFGDSFSCGPSGDGWHSNSLFETRDVNPSNGIYLEGNVSGGPSSEFLPQSLKVDKVEKTKIPTSGIEVNEVQYVDFMSVKHWGDAGKWTTNYAQMAKSTDGGKTWSIIPGTMRTNTNPAKDSRMPEYEAYVDGNENFQMTAMTKHDGYVYVYGTPNGRDGSARLARIREAQFPAWDSAEFWDGSDWVTSQSAAKPVLDGRVSELSVQYNEHLGAWLALYESTEGIVIRKADSPEGPWSAKKTLVSRLEVPDLYGAFMYPHQVDSNLYWVATTWSNYNAMVMKTDLNQVF
ncbi:DUF4185 domain-containing protein [Corynebacterium urogenitale]